MSSAHLPRRPRRAPGLAAVVGLTGLVAAGGLRCGDQGDAPPIDAGPAARDAGPGSLDGGPSDLDLVDASGLGPEPDASTPPAPGIFEVQQGLVAPGSRVALAGVVSAAFDEGFFLSEPEPRPYGGIFVATATRAWFDYAVGDRVEARGRVDELEFTDTASRAIGSRTQLTLLEPNSLDVLETGGAPPSAIVLTLPEVSLPDLAEPYEGLVVELGEASITDISSDGRSLELDRIFTADGRALALDRDWIHLGARFDRWVGALQFDERGFVILPRGPADAPRAAPEADGCLPLGEHLLCLEPQSWDDARIGCAQRGGRLVIMETAAENATVSARVDEHTNRTFWIAANDRATEGTFLWVDGSTLAYDAWANGEPNDAGSGEDCAQGNFRGAGRWNDGRCQGRQTFVCEFEGPAPRCSGDAECGGEGRRCVDGRCRPI